MKNAKESIVALLLAAFILIPVQATGSFRDCSDACNSWCEQESECVECSLQPGCGPTLKRMKKFDGEDCNVPYYACTPGRRWEDSQRNKEACENWCKDNPECTRCSDSVGCGPGRKAIKSWGGRGENYYACASTKYKKASRENKYACKRWCDENPNCERCSTKRSCGGPESSSLKSWTGRGENWHACSKSQSRWEASREHKEQCEQWCKDTAECVKCSGKVGCGKGYSKLRSWTGRGDNVYACAKRESREAASQGNQQACEEWCRGNSACSKCSTNRGCGRGHKALKSWTGRGRNWHACGKR